MKTRARRPLSVLGVTRKCHPQMRHSSDQDELIKWFKTMPTRRPFRRRTNEKITPECSAIKTSGLEHNRIQNYPPHHQHHQCGHHQRRHHHHHHYHRERFCHQLLSCRPLLLLSVAITLVNLITFASHTVVAATTTINTNNAVTLVNQQQGQQQQQLAASNPVIPMPSSGKARYKTMYACEDRVLTMDCDFGSKINLIRANFGRFSITQCNDQSQVDLSTDCMSPITFRIMQDRCQDRQKCSVNASHVIFGDKCPGTPKYLEVHFQCQPDTRVQHMYPSNDPKEPPRVDLRNSSFVSSVPQQVQPLVPSTSATSPVLPPNNNNIINNFAQQRQQQQQQQQELSIPQQPKTVINSDIISYNMADNFNQLQTTNGLIDNNYSNDKEPLIVTLRHIHIDSMTNPRCVTWDQLAKQWVRSGSRILMSNSTHTVCAFDQASSYMLVMDYLGPLTTISQSPSSSPSSSYGQSPRQLQQQLQQQQQQQQTQPSLLPQLQEQPAPQQQQQTPQLETPFESPIPGILDKQPGILDSPPIITSQPDVGRFGQAPPSQQSGALNKFLSVFGYLLAIVFVALAFMSVAFIASSMRSSAGAALKSLGNFSAFNGPKYRHRQDASSAGGHHHSATGLPNKDLLVINNSNGHQFLYAPANSTKISNSSSTHILASGQPQLQAGTLQHLQQRMYSDNGATLSQLSGAQSNHYYGLMGFTSLFQHQQQQQQQQFASQHQLNLNQQQQQQPPPSSYSHQANKSTISNESSASSSGVESGGSANVHHHQQQQQPQPQTQQACLVTLNNDYNLMSNNSHLYGQHQQQQQQIFHHHQQQQQQRHQPTLTLNAHYTTSGPTMVTHGRQMSGREHIYECVDDDKPYMARLLMPSTMEQQQQQQQQQFGTLGGHHQLQQQQLQQRQAMTLSSRLLQDSLANGTQHQLNKRLMNQQQQQQMPAIVRDSQPVAKTNIVCSKLAAQVVPQRATELGKLGQQQQQQQSHHEVMAIYNAQNDTSATAAVVNNSSCFSQAGKLSTDC